MIPSNDGIIIWKKEMGATPNLWAFVLVLIDS